MNIDEKTLLGIQKSNVDLNVNFNKCCNIAITESLCDLSDEEIKKRIATIEVDKDIEKELCAYCQQIRGKVIGETSGRVLQTE